MEQDKSVHGRETFCVWGVKEKNTFWFTRDTNDVMYSCYLVTSERT